MSAEAMEVDPSQPAAVATLNSPPLSPHELLEETRAGMEDVAFRMLSFKKDGGGGGGRAELRELVTQMSLHLITLRQVNRVILVEEERVRAETEAAKVPGDSTMLQLHNLLYEKNHYLKAIKACRDFQTKYPGIHLVPDEEFERSAPQDIMIKTLSADPVHDRMLKRLSFELLQRKELCKFHEKLEKRKSSLLDTIESQKRFLSSLPSHLKSLKKASLPVQQHFGMPHTKKLKLQHAAQLLPLPLYIAFSQLLAQKEAFGERIDVDIAGSTKDAEMLIRKQAINENGQSKADNKKMDDDAPDDEDDNQRRQSRSKSLVEVIPDFAEIYQAHPLKVTIDVYDDDVTQSKPLKLISLRLEYLVKLNVVCVGVEDSGVGCDILCNLFPDDTGLELPHQMSKVYTGDSLNFSERISRPYKWAQHLAGIDFLPEVPPPRIMIPGEALSNNADVSSGLCLYRRQNRAQTILQRIRARKKSQIALSEQLEFLTKLQWQPLGHTAGPWASHTPKCTIDSWSLLGQNLRASSTLAVNEASASVDSDIDRRSATAWEENESTREDGELPGALPAAKSPEDSKFRAFDRSGVTLDHCSSLSLITKSASTPKRSLALSHSFGKLEDDVDYMLDCESDAEPMSSDLEDETSPVTVNAWEQHAERAFRLVLSKKFRGDEVLKIEAKVTISMEYPVRPPLFSVMLLKDAACGLKHYNDLRAMEAEINLHVLEILPLVHENSLLAHQVRYMAMLFDITFDGSHEKRTTLGNKDGLESVSANTILRSLRGRDRKRGICQRVT